MKRFTFILFLLCTYQLTLAQCVGGNRYFSNIFEYDSVMNVKFGANVTASTSTPQDLLLDIYLPKNDTLNKRPVIFFTHGGSFLFGSKSDGDVVYLCREFAKKGYVCISQDYRTGMESFDATSAARAVWRAMQDGKAAVRYMKANASTYNIDTNMIIYGGSSAGGFTALHLAFLDKPNEVLPSIDTNIYTGPGSTGLGNFKGTTNNLPNSSNVHAVINLCGAIGDTSWIEPSDIAIPVINMHGTADATVPYGTAIIKLLNTIPLLKVDGSASIRKKLNQANHPNYFYTFCGADHVPYAGLSTIERDWMNKTVNFLTKHLYEDVLKCGSSNIVINEIDSADCPVSSVKYNFSDDFKLYPNPTERLVNIQSETTITTIEIYDNTSKLILTARPMSKDFSVDVEALLKGIYVLKVISDNKVSHQKFIKH